MKKELGRISASAEMTKVIRTRFDAVLSNPPTMRMRTPITLKVEGQSTPPFPSQIEKRNARARSKHVAAKPNTKRVERDRPRFIKLPSD
jgi:hypothetical protein